MRERRVLGAHPRAGGLMLALGGSYVPAVRWRVGVDPPP